MDYILYDRNYRIIKRFNTQKEAIAGFEEEQRGWLENIGKKMPLLLCYNGFKSINIMQYGMEDKIMKFTFTAVTGTERYRIVDVVTRGERFAADKAGMFASVFYYKMLGHGAEVHDKTKPGQVTIHRAG